MRAWLLRRELNLPGARCVQPQRRELRRATQRNGRHRLSLSTSGERFPAVNVLAWKPSLKSVRIPSHLSVKYGSHLSVKKQCFYPQLSFRPKLRDSTATEWSRDVPRASVAWRGII